MTEKYHERFESIGVEPFRSYYIPFPEGAGRAKRREESGRMQQRLREAEERRREVLRAFRDQQLPTDEELRAEIENQKALFERQAGDRDNVSDFGQMPTESEPST